MQIGLLKDSQAARVADQDSMKLPDPFAAVRVEQDLASLGQEAEDEEEKSLLGSHFV